MDIIAFPARPFNGGSLDEDTTTGNFGNWIVEPKVNGWRALIHLGTGLMWNRHGNILSISDSFYEAISRLKDELPGVEWVDGEVLERRHQVGKGTIIVLDVVVPYATYAERREMVKGVELMPVDVDSIRENFTYHIPSYEWSEAMGVYNYLKEITGNDGSPVFEGVVAKEVSKAYPIQLQSPEKKTPWWVKHRYVG